MGGLCDGCLDATPQWLCNGVWPDIPVPCRGDLAQFAMNHFVKTGKAVEIGCFTGHFSQDNLRIWNHTYFMVDAWQYRPGDMHDKNFKSKEANDRNYNLAKENTDFAGSRRHMIRDLSVQAAVRFEDDSLDWIYIDALHTYEACLGDMKAWYPKLRPGGLFSGDDYLDTEDTPLLTHARQVKHLSFMPFGVIRAVLDFVRDLDVDVHITYLPDCYKFNAWYFIKPDPSRALNIGLEPHTKTSAQTCFRKWPTAPVPCRDDLVDVAQRYFFKTGQAIELGAYQPEFTLNNLNKWSGNYVLIEDWQYHPWKAQRRTRKSLVGLTYNLTRFAGSRRKIIKGTPAGSKHFPYAQPYPDGHFDWIHLGPVHHVKVVSELLEIWYPKLREGGLMTGDDYVDTKHLPYDLGRRFPKIRSFNRKEQDSHFGVAEALDMFARKHSVEVHVTWMNDCHYFDDWYFVKPETVRKGALPTLTQRKEFDS